MKSDKERREVRRESVKDWKKRHSNKTKKIYQRNAQRWAKNNPEKQKLIVRRALLKKYGMTLEEYDQMFAQQKGVCSICRLPSTKTLAVDHCHKTSKVRGLLCSKCNKGLGHFNDDPALLQLAIEYLIAA